MAKRSEQIKQALRHRRGADGAAPRLLSTGSTLLNLACSGRPEGGFPVGHYVLLCGDSDSGKTFLGLTCLAEAAIDPAFDGYRLVYDAPEGGALMDVERFFGRRLAERLEQPSDSGPSVTVQEFYAGLDRAFDDKRPFVWVLDSQDCLSSDQEIEKTRKERKARGRGEREAGSYGDAKAKVHSACLRRVMGPLRETGSLLVIANQTRDSFDPFNQDAYSGGRALKFYAKLQLWSKAGGAIKRHVQGKDRQVGVYAKVRVKKNHLTGRDRQVVVPIYHSCGMDDCGGMVDYLVAEGVWADDRGAIAADGLGPVMRLRREALVAKIQEAGMEDDLRALVTERWAEVEDACRVERKSRYG